MGESGSGEVDLVIWTGLRPSSAKVQLSLMRRLRLVPSKFFSGPILPTDAKHLVEHRVGDR